MDERLRAELLRNDGLIVASRLPAEVPRWAMFNAVRAGALVRLHPGVYAAADVRVDPLRAAEAYVDGRAALSHTSALHVWGLRPRVDEPVHMTALRGRRLTSCAELVVHYRLGFTMSPPWVVNRAGHWVTTVEAALVDAWPLLTEEDRLRVVMNAVSERMTTPTRLGTELARAPHLRGRRQARELLDRLAQGCRSYLEIFGVAEVFTDLGDVDLRQQVPVKLNGRTVYLDVFAERERVDFELDGMAWHGDRIRREADMRRDAALATLGILVVRFSYQRLVNEPDQVRREVRRILSAHRRP